MNLDKLFETQKVLDAHIELVHPRNKRENRFIKKLIALRVEISELANELPETFKFWSNKKNNYYKALKEYVDCLHFILSLGLEKNITQIKIKPIKSENLTVQLQHLYECIDVFQTNENFYGDLVNLFIGLGEMLGFTWEQIEEAYYQKNEVNHERQNTGY